MKCYFSWKGRMNRLRYALCKLIFILPLVFITQIILWNTPESVGLVHHGLTFVNFTLLAVSIPMTVFEIFWTIQRCHDLDKPGYYIFLGIVPVVNIVWGLYLLFAKGTNGANRFGRDPLAYGYGFVEEIV